MKPFIPFVILFIISCNYTNQVNSINKSKLDSTKAVIKLEDTLFTSKKYINQDKFTCKSIDFMQLRNKDIQKQFFMQLDSVLKIQYPKGNKEAEIFIDLNTQLLTMFLKDIDTFKLEKFNEFEKEYHFKISPKTYTDPKECKDKISIEFSPNECYFRVTIGNTFLVKPNWCVESQVIYSFKIKGNKIINFYRNAAG